MKKILSFIVGVTFVFANSKAGDIGFRYGFLSQPSYGSDSISVLSDSSIIHTGNFLKINIGFKNNTSTFIESSGLQPTQTHFGSILGKSNDLANQS